jgi:uncharacterized membrane protein
MSLRSARERVIQTIGFEIGGLLIASPLYAVIMGAGAAESFVLMAVLSGAVMIWTPMHNTVFDWVEWRRWRRLASDRPPLLRIVHAVSHEVTTVVVTVPVILLMTDLGIWAALLLDLGLSLFYMVYAYVFYLIYDRLRPMRWREA